MNILLIITVYEIICPIAQKKGAASSGSNEAQLYYIMHFFRKQYQTAKLRKRFEAQFIYQADCP